MEGEEPHSFRGLTITMVINHLLNGMILQVGGTLNCASSSAARLLAHASAPRNGRIHGGKMVEYGCDNMDVNG